MSDDTIIDGYRYMGKISTKLASEHFNCADPVLAFENDNEGDYLSHWEKAVFL